MRFFQCFFNDDDLHGMTLGLNGKGWGYSLDCQGWHLSDGYSIVTIQRENTCIYLAVTDTESIDHNS